MEGACKEEWRGKEEGNSFSREGQRTAEKLRRRSGGFGGEWVGWSHIGHVSVSVEMCVTHPLSSFSPRNSEEETPGFNTSSQDREREGNRSVALKPIS